VPLTSRSGLICYGLSHGQICNSSLVTAFRISSSPYSNPSFKSPLHKYGIKKIPFPLLGNSCHWSLQLSSASSFEAPEPPKSRGQAVFPDIQFQHDAESGDEASEVSMRRNSDLDAVFVVTGASRGIGLQFVKSLTERTKGKIVSCCRSPSDAWDLQQFANQHSDRIQVLPLDVEAQSTIDTLALKIAQTYGRVDALFNVAGILGDGKSTPGPERTVAAIDREWLEKSLAVNTIGPVMLTKALSPLMRTTGRRSVMIDKPTDSNVSKDGSNKFEVDLPEGRLPTVIVNLSARVGSTSDNQLGGWYTYRLSKAALNSATKTLGLELKRQGTWIVALHPGTTNTSLSKPFQKNVKEGRLFPVDFTVDSLLNLVESLCEKNTGGFYDWAGKALPY